MQKHLRIAAIALIAVFLFSGTTALAADDWTQYGRGGHASAHGDSVSFSGHPQDPFVSLLFRPANDGDYRVLTFHLSEGVSDWHTLEGSGFLFNAGISGGILNGYAVLFTQSEVGFYKITNANVGALGSQHFSAISGVQKLESKPKPAYSSGTTWYLKLVMSPGTVKVEKHDSPGFTGSSETIFSTTMNDTSGGSGYGPFASFISHDCSSISTSTLEYFNLTITPNTLPTVSAPDVTLSRGETFSEMSDVSAADKEDGDLSSAVAIASNDVNTNIPGEYNITYAVSDLAGASANHTRKVTVLADALFDVTDDRFGEPVPGVGITIAGHGEKTSGGDGETERYVLLPGTYEWSVTTPHKDFLPLAGPHAADISQSGTSSWPMQIPVQLTRKVYDVGVSLTTPNKGSYRYNDTATFTMTLANNGNVATIPTVDVNVPHGLSLVWDAASVDGAASPTDVEAKRASASDDFVYTHPTVIEPGESTTVELPMLIHNIAESATEILTVTVSSLSAEDAAVQDGNSSNDAATQEITVKNPPVILTKIDALTEKPIAGVEIEITNSDGTSMYSGKSDQSGKWVVHGLLPGAYTITETQGIAGYAKAASTWAFTRADDLSVTGDTTLTNSSLTLEIVKTDKHTGKPIEGVVFTISTMGSSGALIKAGQQENGEWFVATTSDAQGNTQGSSDGTAATDNKAGGSAEVITDKNGKIVLRYLPAGEYILIEKTPIGYADAKPIDATIGQDNGMEKPVHLEIVNSPTMLVVEKIDALTGKAVRVLSANTDTSRDTNASVALFRLLNDKGEPVKLSALDSGGLHPDPSGKELFAVDTSGLCDIFYLPIGAYSIEEMTAPIGYGKVTPTNVEIKGEHSTGNMAKVQVADAPLALRIQKEKKSGGSLSGAGFTLTARSTDKPLTFSIMDGVYHYDPKGVENTIMVDKQGVALVYYLPVGDYTLTETVTPEGYFNTYPITVKIGIENTTEKPAEVKVINEAEVKLGMDSDRWRVVIASSLILLALAGLATVFIMKNKAERSDIS